MLPPGSKLEGFKKQKISFRWYCFPHSKPDNLDSILQELNPHSVTETQTLYIEEKNYPMQFPAHVTVEELTRKNLNEYTTACNEGWELTGAPAEKLKADITQDFETGMKYRAFLARYNGLPAATAILRVIDDVGFLQGGH